MTTRAAIVIGVADEYCESPPGIVPKMVNHGADHVVVVVQVETVYSNALFLPKYKYKSTKSKQSTKPKAIL